MENIVGFVSSEMRFPREILIKNGSTELFKQDVLPQIKRALQE